MIRWVIVDGISWQRLSASRSGGLGCIWTSRTVLGAVLLAKRSGLRALLMRSSDGSTRAPLRLPDGASTLLVRFQRMMKVIVIF